MKTVKTIGLELSNTELEDLLQIHASHPEGPKPSWLRQIVIKYQSTTSVVISWYVAKLKMSSSIRL